MGDDKIMMLASTIASTLWGVVPSSIEIESLPLNRGGYDKHGRYFGQGEPVFRLCANDAAGYFLSAPYLRAPNRKALRDALKVAFPNAKIGR